jgi:hypothetical protein
MTILEKIIATVVCLAIALLPSASELLFDWLYKIN